MKAGLRCIQLLSGAGRISWSRHYVRGAVSIGRRLTDLWRNCKDRCKVDRRWTYQHDVDRPNWIRLDEVVMSCVNSVGVDNTASKELLFMCLDWDHSWQEYCRIQNKHGAFKDRGALQRFLVWVTKRSNRPRVPQDSGFKNRGSQRGAPGELSYCRKFAKDLVVPSTI